MKRRFSNLVVASLAAALAVIGLFTGCDGSAGSQVQGGDTIRVGVNMELSGGWGWLGATSLHGIELGVQHINDGGGINGRPLELVVHDNGSSAARAVTVTTRLTTRDRTVAILGPVDSDIFNASASVASHQNIPIISSAALSQNALLGPDGVLFGTAFRTGLASAPDGDAMARYSVGTLGARNVLVVRDAQASWVSANADSFVETLGDQGGAVAATETFAPGQRDFGELLGRIRQTTFDALYVVGGAVEGASFVRQARDAGITGPIMAAGTLGDAAATEIMGPVSQVHYPVQFTMLDTSNPHLNRFVEDYRAATGTEPDQWAALAYDSVLLLADAMSRSGQISGVEVRNALSITRDFTGVTGTYNVDDDHEPGKAPIVVELVDGNPGSVSRAF